MKPKSIVSVAVAICTLAVAASCWHITKPNPASDFTYTIDGGSATITQYIGSRARVTIPAKIDGNMVTSVGDFAFAGFYGLINVTMPASVTNIGKGAFAWSSTITNINVPDGVANIGDITFEGCENLRAISIPNGVTSIGNRAFYGCKNLAKVTIPGSTTNIGDEVFGLCLRLTSITVAASNNCYKDIDGVLFTKDGRELVCYPGGRAAVYTIPSGTISIRDGAFAQCRDLTDITISDSVTSIGYEAFSQCQSLTSIIMPCGIISIGYRAFYGCNNLVDIAVPDSVTSIGCEAFSCPNLTITCSPNSFTYGYCTENGIGFKLT